MKLVLSGVLGFCMGVRRAVDLAFAEADGAGGAPGRVWTFGQLIHNNNVLSDLKKRGVGVLGQGPDWPDLSGSVVVVCAHGVPPGVEEDLKARGARVVDASCPMVKNSQRMAAELGQRNITFLAGERNHSETISIKGYNPALIIVQNEDEAHTRAQQLHKENPRAQTALLAQTTISAAEYMSISKAIKGFFPHVEVHNTICGATASRQKALRALCKKVDAALIAGAQNSSNARRLLSIAHDHGIPAWLVENASDLPREIFTYNTVGLSAGASTPDGVIDEIKRRLESP